jgi:multicomponent Na+:H+ antiporter subunit E
MYMKRKIITFTALAATWLLWSGHLETSLLIYGFLSVLLVMWISIRMDHFSEKPHVYRLGLRPIIFVPWLLKEIVKSNIEVALIILKPRLPISPCLIRLQASQLTDLGKVIYANSITLTPGTITLDVRGDAILVHNLTSEMAEDLLTGDMDRRVTKLEGKV